MEYQDKKITDYLIEKRLPLDILLEVKDHMADQVAALETEQNITFDNAFEQTKASWGKDLEMRFSFFSYKFRKITRLQNSIMMRNQLRIQKKSLLIMLAIFFVTSYFILYIPKLSMYAFIAFNGGAAILGIAVSILGRKLLETTKGNYKKNISVFQRSVGNLMLTGALFITANNILGVDSQIEKISGSLNEIFFQHNFKPGVFAHATMSYLYIYMVVYGYLNYISYKKAIIKIKERITLEF
ncbi:hypothetical protein ATE49_00135 [Elizabethkingia miricola]|uniref:Uncharacterized protein n=1 Tax=Elizabethkingia miricola TaxID=172045 RepID=A0ABY3NEI5_ELIMR|nr:MULTISPECIES: hypothetical protein [Elizabethkingia]OBS13807.1 hypothetical protein ATE49_00135 [Elizabethkingia miricola]TYO90241.1 hypothetical protein LX74_02493 [Elizabethkingia miricola]